MQVIRNVNEEKDREENNMIDVYEYHHVSDRLKHLHENDPS